MLAFSVSCQSIKTYEPLPNDFEAWVKDHPELIEYFKN